MLVVLVVHPAHHGTCGQTLFAAAAMLDVHCSGCIYMGVPTPTRMHVQVGVDAARRTATSACRPHGTPSEAIAAEGYGYRNLLLPDMMVHWQAAPCTDARTAPMEGMHAG